MTNNPTIDGVSRELLRKQFEEKNEHRGWFVPGGIAETDTPEGFVYSDFTTDMCWTCYFEAKSSDAPAVERQEPAKCGNCGSTSADICNQNGCGFLESGNGELEVAALQSTLFDAIAHGDDAHRGWLKAAIDAHFSRSPMPEYVPSGKDQTVDALKSTIAQLQARIAELESGSK